MIREILLYFCALVLGFALAGILFQPQRQYRRGWNAARKKYQDYNLGYASGWNNAMEAVRRVANAWFDKSTEDNDS